MCSVPRCCSHCCRDRAKVWTEGGSRGLQASCYTPAGVGPFQSSSHCSSHSHGYFYLQPKVKKNGSFVVQFLQPPPPQHTHTQHTFKLKALSQSSSCPPPLSPIHSPTKPPIAPRVPVVPFTTHRYFPKNHLPLQQPVEYTFKLPYLNEDKGSLYSQQY